MPPWSDHIYTYGMLRMIRDVFHISGFLEIDAGGQIVQIRLNPTASLAPALAGALQELLAPNAMVVHLDKI